MYSTQIHIANAHKRLSKKFTIYECTVTQLLQSIMWYIHIHTFFYILHNKHYRINPYFCKLFSLCLLKADSLQNPTEFSVHPLNELKDYCGVKQTDELIYSLSLDSLYHTAPDSVTVTLVFSGSFLDVDKELQTECKVSSMSFHILCSVLLPVSIQISDPLSLQRNPGK